MCDKSAHDPVVFSAYFIFSLACGVCIFPRISLILSPLFCQSRHTIAVAVVACSCFLMLTYWVLLMVYKWRRTYIHTFFLSSCLFTFPLRYVFVRVFFFPLDTHKYLHICYAAVVYAEETRTTKLLYWHDCKSVKYQMDVCLSFFSRLGTVLINVSKTKQNAKK